MRKSAVVMPVLALILGLAGFMFRRMEVNTVFNAATGLAKRGALVTMIVIGVSLLAVVIAAVFALTAASRYKADTEYTRAFAPRGLGYLCVSFLLAAGWLAADVLYFVNRRMSGGLTVIDFIFVVLAALSAAAVVVLARRAYRGSGGSEMLLFGFIPPIFFCFWLVILYKDNATNPVLLSYCYQVLAISAAALSYYFSAGFIYRKAVTGRVIVSFLAAVYFCAVVIADNIGLPVKIMFGITAVNMMLNAFVFIRNLKFRAA